MKKCPFCAEQIQTEAVKCKHCGEWLPSEERHVFDEAAIAQSNQQAQVSNNEREVAKSPLSDRPSAPKILGAWALAVFVLLPQQGRFLLSTSEFSPMLKLLGVGIVCLNALVAIALLLTLRESGPVRRAPYGIWGLTWRAVLAIYASALVKLLVLYSVSVEPALAELSLQSILAWEVLTLLAVCASVWVLFSPDRRGQIRKVIVTIRGY